MKHQKGFAPGTLPISATNPDRSTRTVPAFLALIAVAGLVLLYGPSPDYYDHRILHAFWAWGHLAFFAVLTLLLLRWRVPQWQGPVGWWSLGLAVLLGSLAILSELIQLGVPGRMAGPDDALQNLLGIMVGFGLSPHWLARLPLRWSRLLPHLALPVVALAALVPWVALADTLHGKTRFPLLLSMETELEMTRVSGSEDRRRVLSTPLADSPLLAARWYPPGSGLGVQHFPGDWRDYEQLHIRIHSDRAVPVTLRLHDRPHEDMGQPYTDRFNHRLALETGWQTLVIDLEEVSRAPSSRTMDMARMSQLGLFSLQLDAPVVLHLASIELAGSPE